VSPELSLRPLEPHEVPDVALLHASAFGEHTVGSVARAADNLREELRRAWSQVWVAWKEGRAVGSIVLWVVADEVHILDVATHPGSRRQGVGRALVSHAVEVARSRAAKSLFLEVRRSNEGAIALYRAAGFEVVGVRKRYYPDDEDALDMSMSV
jgi:[ribosomal protein S18]-alanine N-acetyltransferase